MSKALRRIAVAGVLLAAAALGYYTTAVAGPERLHREVERWLSEVTQRPARLESLRLAIGLPFELQATGLTLWDGALTSEHASARISLGSLLSGRPRLARLRLDGADLHLVRGPDGHWNLPFIPPPSGKPQDEPALAPLRVIESATRLLLSKPLLADTLIVRRSRVRVTHPALDDSETPIEIAFHRVNGRLAHSNLFDDARLSLRVHLIEDGRDLGMVEWQGVRDDDGAMQVDMAANRLALGSFLPYLRGARSGATLGGRLDGFARYRTSERGIGSLMLDLVLADLETSLAEDPTERGAPLSVEASAVRMTVDLEPDRVTLEDARLSAGDLDLELEAAFSRPLSDASDAAVALAVEDLPLGVETARAIGALLPRRHRASYASIAERVRSGRVVRGTLDGETRVAQWRRALAGSLEELPAGFGLRVDLEALDVQLDPKNRLEHLGGVLRFAGDRLEVEGAEGDLNGSPLPELDLSFDGLSKLLSTPPKPPGPAPRTEALVGLTTLWEVLRPEGGESSPAPPIAIYFEHLHHPALLWPVDDLDVELVVEPESDGVRLRVRNGDWAGVSLDGEVEWTPGPARRVDVALAVRGPTAGPAPAPTPGSGPDDAGSHAWAVGRFDVGAMSGPGWQQRGARGRFRATGGTVRIEEAAIDLEPSGELAGWVEIGLADAGRVPYRTELTLRESDVAAVIRLFGAREAPVTGTLDTDATLSGSLVPGRSLLHDADGSLRLVARDGTIARSVPPVFALALASRSLNPFSGRDAIRYGRTESDMTLSDGRLSTEAIDLDGPDLRMFASGSVDLAATPHTLDTEVVLFLFRQLDAALGLIPVVNVLLLGDSDNLIAAYYEVVGSWDKPVAKAKPMRTLGGGPTAIITKGIPRIVGRGMKAVGGIFGGSDDGESREEAVGPDAEAETETGPEALPAPGTGAETPAAGGPAS